MVKRVLVIQNDAPETLGLYEALLREKTELTLVHAYEMREHEEFPPVDGFDAFVVGPRPSRRTKRRATASSGKSWST